VADSKTEAGKPTGFDGKTEPEWLGPLRDTVSKLLQDQRPAEAMRFMSDLGQQLRAAGVDLPLPVNTPYVNTISVAEQPDYPGDLELEDRILSLVRWNAMAMVVKGNKLHAGLGGHISTFGSLATLYEVGMNHFFQGPDGQTPADLIYFQGHASPGNYARAYLEFRLDADLLHHFRLELAESGGLPSYPHPWLMREYWQFPTVSMGLGPITSIYQARFSQYLKNRGLIEAEPRVWCFVGDGEMEEPESNGGLSLAGREKLDKLVWVVDCNLQRLDGPVRGSGKIIQELEARFRGAGWNVIKLVWGGGWDPLLADDWNGLLRQRMEEVVDGDYQKYSVESGAYIRKHFFGKYPELLDRVAHLKDEDLRQLNRGGHDPVKIYAAYQAAVSHTGKPTVILAKTIKGYGLGQGGEGHNVTHQQKKLTEGQLRYFRDRFKIPVPDDEIGETPFYRPGKEAPESKYLFNCRKKLGGWQPQRRVEAPALSVPALGELSDFLQGSASPASTTMALVRLLGTLLRHQSIGRRLVPIIPDEARTFGLDSLFRQVGIYAPEGQLYEPVDKGHLLYYREEKDGQILEEGITEAGSVSSFIAAGNAYANHGLEMIPCYIFYSMFGFQRVGDLLWAAGDARAKGFLFGATAGRTTLNGEGLQHQDGHSHVLASAHPNMLCYDPAFAHELAVIVQEGLHRMFAQGEQILYYVTVYNENYAMPRMPEDCRDGIIRGLYRFRRGQGGDLLAHIFASGTILQEALRAQVILGETFGVSADVWSATSYKRLRVEALEAERWNRLHPLAERRKPEVEQLLENETGPCVAVSDFSSLVPEQIAPWVPGGLVCLGTDGFGRSDTRARLRRFFEIDAEHIVLAILTALAGRGQIGPERIAEAMTTLGVDPNQASPELTT
jgi:pyruvate dehydrogenase E1 component